MKKIKTKIKKGPLNKVSKTYDVTQDTYRRRFIVIAFMMFFLFLVVILRLYQVMLRDQKKYEENLQVLATKTVEGTSAPRGRIFDRNGKVIVDNKAIKVISYQKEKGRSAKEEIKLAYTVSKHLNLNYDRLSEKMKREFFVAKHKTEMNQRITKAEWEKLEQRKLSNQQINNLKLERVSKEELDQFSEEDQKAYYTDRLYLQLSLLF